MERELYEYLVRPESGTPVHVWGHELQETKYGRVAIWRDGYGLVSIVPPQATVVFIRTVTKTEGGV